MCHCSNDSIAPFPANHVLIKLISLDQLYNKANY